MTTNTTKSAPQYPPWLVMGITLTVCVCLIFGLYMILEANTKTEHSETRIDSLEKQVNTLQENIVDLERTKANAAAMGKLTMRIGEIENVSRDNRD